MGLLPGRGHPPHRLPLPAEVATVLKEGLGRRARGSSRRRRLLTHGLPVLVVAAAAFGYGIYVAGGAGRAQRALVSDYVHAWAGGAYPHMYSLLDHSSKQRISEAQFVAAYQNASATATLSSVRPLHLGPSQGGGIPVSMLARTTAFGR